MLLIFTWLVNARDRSRSLPSKRSKSTTRIGRLAFRKQLLLEIRYKLSPAFVFPLVVIAISIVAALPCRSKSSLETKIGRD